MNKFVKIIKLDTASITTNNMYTYDPCLLKKRHKKIQSWQMLILYSINC